MSSEGQIGNPNTKEVMSLMILTANWGWSAAKSLRTGLPP